MGSIRSREKGNLFSHDASHLKNQGDQTIPKKLHTIISLALAHPPPRNVANDLQGSRYLLTIVLTIILHEIKPKINPITTILNLQAQTQLKVKIHLAIQHNILGNHRTSPRQQDVQDPHFKMDNVHLK